jgi:regulator of cell morphogenesis and NO signaling
MNTFNILQKVRDIVTIMPQASTVFKEYNIDFCCGGNRTLAEIIKDQAINQEEILERLDNTFEETKKLTQNPQDFRTMTRSMLVDYIVNKHHAYTKSVLPKLSELTTKILRVHGANHNVLFRVHTLFHNLKTDLDQHLIKEEEIVFPMIKEYDKNPSPEALQKVRKAIDEIESEHDAAGDILKELRKITDDYTVPADGCTTYALTFKLMQELESDLFEHIHLENNILFHIGE